MMTRSRLNLWLIGLAYLTCWHAYMRYATQRECAFWKRGETRYVRDLGFARRQELVSQRFTANYRSLICSKRRGVGDMIQMFDSETDTSTVDFDSFFMSAKAAADQQFADSHFTRDCLWIVEHAQQSLDYFPGIAAMVLLSIQQPFYRMPQYIADVVKRDLRSTYLFGHKRFGLEYVRWNKRQLWESARACYKGEISLDDLIYCYLRIPNLGIVKASFLAQMTVGQGACIDTLNQRVLGVTEEFVAAPKTLTEKSMRRRIARYNAAWQSLGDTVWWWDDWCERLAARTHNAIGSRIGTFESGAQVSALHRLAITGDIK